MKKGLNLWSLNWSGRRGQPTFRDVARITKSIGYQGIELTFDEENLDPKKETERQVAQFRTEATSAGIDLPSVATGIFWKYNLGSGDKKLRETGIEMGKYAIRLASTVGARVLLVVPGVSEASTSYRKTYEFSKESISQMVEAAEKFNVMIGVENVWNRFLYSPLEFKEFIEEIGSKKVGAYLDVANIIEIGHPLHWIEELGSRIVMVHAKDFDSSVGNISAFRHIGKGNVDWREAVSALRRVRYDGYLIVECPPSFAPGLKNPTFEDARKLAEENSKALDGILK